MFFIASRVKRVGHGKFASQVLSSEWLIYWFSVRNGGKSYVFLITFPQMKWLYLGQQLQTCTCLKIEAAYFLAAAVPNIDPSVHRKAASCWSTLS
jgi:hypothetical protein